MMCDEKLDRLLAQWAHEDIPLPEDFHQRTMIRIQAEARRQRKQKIRKMWGGAIAAVVLLCCIPFARIQLDRLSLGSGASIQTQPMVAVESGTVEPGYSASEDEMLSSGVQNAAASSASSEAKSSADKELSIRKNVYTNGNPTANEILSADESTPALEEENEDNSSKMALFNASPQEQAPSVEIPMVASLEEFDDNTSVTPYSRNVNEEAAPEDTLAITATQIEDYRAQLAQANADLRALNEQLAQYEKQLSEASTNDIQAKKEETDQKIKDLEQKIKTIEDSINTLEEKRNAHQ